MKTSDKEYPICDNIGWLINFQPDRKIPDSLKEIGLGPSLYIYMLKAFIRLFVVLTILHIPTYVLCYSGGASSINQSGTFDLSNFLQIFSVGNLGESKIIGVQHEVKSLDSMDLQI